MTKVYNDTKDYYYLTTAAPKIIEKIMPADCLVITPYGPNLRMGSFINAMSTFNIRSSWDKILEKYNCIYFFKDYLCDYEYSKKGMKEDCDFFKKNYYLIPKIVIGSKKINMTYTLYRIYTKTNDLNETQYVKKVYID
ncbi:MAG: hypothetical protein ACFFG0_38370 [Candidatus Thorarchaeota archaeon]